TVDDAYHIGSCTKPITATVIGTLVEEHKLAWDTKVLDIFPEWKSDIRPEFAPVTLSDLLSHEAGVEAFGEEEEIAKVPELTGSIIERRRAFAHFALQQPPVAPPRTTFKYSNAGYVIAAAMAERVTGKSWETLVRERIFAPLKMKSAGEGWPERLWGHAEVAGGTLQAVDPHGPYQLKDYIAPCGDLHMTADDLARFLRAHLLAMRGGTTIISPSTAAVMHTKRIKSGLGFGVATFAGFDNVATHSGSADTFTTVIAIAAKQNVAIVVQTNAAGDAATHAAGVMLRDLLVRFARQ
ncbi:MAG TPA: serine hydrolase domain-containing protein, partial [Thermoanaerobaculia bacterium]|nr:serine hydrolase domain-containing protein [Thermoanaerobaculia bacterium]